MKTAIRLIFAIAFAAGIFCSDNAAGKKDDGAAYITAVEVRALVGSGHLVPAGRDAWRTRGGLLIAGRDPDGRTRLVHIMRHMQDEPGRPKHGVFSLAKAGVIELMDEAWKEVVAGNADSRERAGRVAYTVRFRKKVGFLGGRVGRTRGYPALRSARLVVIKGTNRVITFFPI
ncbi:MAG: hypothetical protein JXA07_16320 [Spirochaetes bacterium]|nr:hypothetical protein [Spirochaetota bacterium]